MPQNPPGKNSWAPVESRSFGRVRVPRPVTPATCCRSRASCYRVRYRSTMKECLVAYVTEKRGVFYAVIYEGRNPVSGREQRRWHRCDTRADAERVAGELTDRRRRHRRSGSSMTLQEYLLGQWLPAKEHTLAPVTTPATSRRCATICSHTSVTQRCGACARSSSSRSIGGCRSMGVAVAGRSARRRSRTSTPRCMLRSTMPSVAV